MVLVSIFVIILDQLSKYLAVKHLKGGQGKNIIGNFLKFEYVENRGAAFGILENRRIFFILLTFLVIGLLIFILYKDYKILGNFQKFIIYLYIGGAIGNLIDRFIYGYVVDFISVRFFNSYDFPVFNIADIAIVIGTVLVLVQIFIFNRNKP